MSTAEVFATEHEDLRQQMLDLGQAARAAARTLAVAPGELKDQALAAMADALMDRQAAIIEANARDVDTAREQGRPNAFIDRLTLNEERVEAMARGLRQIATFPDPVGAVMASWDRPNGLKIERVRTPLGVIGVIFESRPNVMADAGGLCLKAGNASILRGGSDSFFSCGAIHDCLTDGLVNAQLPAAAIQRVPTTDRAAVGMMLQGLAGALDVIVPRGGRSLVERVQSEARVPVFAHLEGVCHVYVDKSADLEKAKNIVLNSKLRRTGICGAAETLLVDRSAPKPYLGALISALLDAGCEVRGDNETMSTDPRVSQAGEDDWPKEFLDKIIAVKTVDGVDGALAHIAQFGSNHTEAIVTEDRQAAERFLARADSAILLHNASTQFADGGEFGMGAEIGIATGRMHARGPVGIEQLTSFKYVVRGDGQVRP